MIFCPSTSSFRVLKGGLTMREGARKIQCDHAPVSRAGPRWAIARGAMRLLTRAQPALKVMLRASGFRLRSVETGVATLRYFEHRAPATGAGPVVFLHGIAS